MLNTSSALHDLVVALDQLDENDPLMLVSAANLGQEIEAALADPAVLRSLAETLSAVAHERGCQALKGASTGGSYLAAATAAVDGTLGVVTNGSSPKRVLLVDHLLVTGYSMQQAADYLLRHGATEVFACVVASVAGETTPAGCTELVTLDVR